jgi:hypothetical protein
MAKVLPSLHLASLSGEMQADVICPLFPTLQDTPTEAAPPLCLLSGLAAPIIGNLSKSNPYRSLRCSSKRSAFSVWYRSMLTAGLSKHENEPWKLARWSESMVETQRRARHRSEESVSET